jgi:hypothetical protein
MSQINHQSPRQHSYETTTSPRNDSMKHTQMHRKEAKEPIKLGKFLRTDQTVRLAVVDCPLGRGGLSGRQARMVRNTKDVSNRKTRFCLNVSPNGREPLSDCPPAADCPGKTRGRSMDEQRRKMQTRKNTFPKSSPDLPNDLRS